MWLMTLAVLASAPAGYHVPVAPAESVWVEVSGEGRTIVLVPGLAGSAFAFRNVRPLLHAAGFRTVVIEPLGTGRSSRPRRADYSLTAQAARIGAVLDTLDESGVVLVGHSAAVSMALRLARRRPDLVGGIVSLDGGPAEVQGSASMRRALSFAPLVRVFGGRSLMRRQLASQLVDASGDASWVTEPVLDGYAAPVVADLGSSLAVYRAIAGAQEPERLDTALPEVRCPVLVLWGGAPEKGAGLRAAELDLLRRGLPDLTVRVLDGAGHYVHEERPEAVAEAIAGFARETAPDAAARKSR